LDVLRGCRSLTLLNVEGSDGADEYHLSLAQLPDLEQLDINTAAQIKTPPYCPDVVPSASVKKRFLDSGRRVVLL
jgi:hypothetical protein